MMASAAVGGSHIIASTQAGALYGWQLAIIIILANLFKYPFFRFGYQYTLDSGESLLSGYARKGKLYIWAFFMLNIFAAVVNTAAVLLLCASILKFVLPLPEVIFGIKDVTFLCWAVLAVCLLMLLAGKYAALDTVSKIIMVTLTVTTVLAVVIAANRGAVAPPDFQGPSPWNLAALGFLVALMGWMPAPIEISAITSMWVAAKKQTQKISRKDGLFDFDVGYIGTALLALVFLTLGALVQYGSGQAVENVGGKYIAQFINMYASTIGEWSRLIIAFIAFACMFGTTITVIDGYSRTNVESLRILTKQSTFSGRALSAWIIFTSFAGMLIILAFASALGPMLKFAMIASFVTTPVFAGLNLSLVRGKGHKVSKVLIWLAWTGLFYLTAFALLFLAYLMKLL